MVLAGAFAVAACGSDGGGSVEAFCAAGEELAATMEEDPFEGDPETLDERLDQVRSLSQAAADAAPDEISDEMDILNTTNRELLDAFSGIDDPTEEDAAFEQVFPDDETFEEFQEAEETVGTYVVEQCGIEIGDDSEETP